MSVWWYRIFILADLVCSIVIWGLALGDLLWGERRLLGTRISNDAVGSDETHAKLLDVIQAMTKVRTGFALRTITFLLQILAVTLLVWAYFKMVTKGSLSLSLAFIWIYLGLTVITVILGGVESWILIHFSRWGPEVGLKCIIIWYIYSRSFQYRTEAGSCIVS